MMRKKTGEITSPMDANVERIDKGDKELHLEDEKDNNETYKDLTPSQEDQCPGPGYRLVVQPVNHKEPTRYNWLYDDRNYSYYYR